MARCRLTALLLASIGNKTRDWFDSHGTAVIGTVVFVVIAIVVLRRVIPAAIRPAVTRQMSGRPPLEVTRRVETLSSVLVRTAEIIVIASHC